MIESLIATFLLYALWKLYRAHKIVEQQMLEEAADKILSNIVTIEKVYQSGSLTWLIYSYQENPIFLAQGNTEAEAIKNLQTLFPGREFFQVHEKL